jgi:hypothetical protein
MLATSKIKADSFLKIKNPDLFLENKNYNCPLRVGSGETLYLFGEIRVHETLAVEGEVQVHLGTLQ